MNIGSDGEIVERKQSLIINFLVQVEPHYGTEYHVDR